MLVLGCDHGGFPLKAAVKKYLTENHIEFYDVGCDGESCDYPDIAARAVRLILDGTCEKGILLCGTGIGISIAANRYAGIRAALVSDPVAAKLATEHNHANVLCMGGRMIGENVAAACIDAWLRAEFAGGRHQRRIDKIEEVKTI